MTVALAPWIGRKFENADDLRLGTWRIGDPRGSGASDSIGVDNDHCSYFRYLGDNEWKIIGLQGCGNLTMNLWFVAYYCAPEFARGKEKRYQGLIHLLEEGPLFSDRARKYSCLIKWRDANGQYNGMSIQDLRFNPYGKDRTVWDAEHEFVIPLILRELEASLQEDDGIRMQALTGPLDCDPSSSDHLEIEKDLLMCGYVPVASRPDAPGQFCFAGEGETSKLQIDLRPQGNLTDNIEFAVFGQQVIKHGRTVPLETIIHQFSDVRHVYRVPNLRRHLAEEGLDPGADLWFGEYELLHNPDILRGALSRPVLLSLSHRDGRYVPLPRPDPAREHRIITRAFEDILYEKVPDDTPPRKPGQFRFNPVDPDLVDVWLMENIYPFSFLGLGKPNEHGRSDQLILLAVSGASGRQGLTLRQAVEKLRTQAQAWNALRIDQE